VVMNTLHKNSSKNKPLADLQARFRVKAKAFVDHSMFSKLKVNFAKPQDVTATCISCHNGRQAEVMRSSHWNWERTEYVPGTGIRSIGKRDVLNNFCIGLGGKEQSCERRHAGYSLSTNNADLKDPLNVDCLACHGRKPWVELCGFGMMAFTLAGAVIHGGTRLVWRHK
jgi:hypothetical protein